MGMTVQIYRWALGDCTNNGASNRHDTLTLTNVEGPWEPTEKAPAAKLIRCKTGALAIVPDEIAERWHMFGGNFAYSSDSRFKDAVAKIVGHRDTWAVPVFDRVED